MAEMKRRLEQLIEEDFNEAIMDRKKYGSLPIGIPDEIIKVFSQALADYWDIGRTFGLDQAHKIVHEVVGKTIQDELKKHPKMSLRTYAKQYGYIKEEEK